MFLFFACCLYSEDFECTADNVSTSFSESGEPITTVLEGRIRIVSGDIIIECDRAIINHVSGEIKVETGLTFSQNNLRITSARFAYNIQNDTGTFFDNKFSYAPFYGKSELVEKEENKISARRCILTTCDREKPHYHLLCDSIRISPDRITIRGLKIYFGTVPILYIPGYSYNLKTKKPLFQVSYGYKTEIGNGISLIFNKTSSDARIDISQRFDIGTEGLGAGIRIEDGTVPETQPSRKNFSSYAFKRYGDADVYYGFSGEFQQEFKSRQNIILDWRWMRTEQFFRNHLYDVFLAKSRNPNYFSYTQILGQGIFGINVIDNAREDFLSPARIPEIEFSVPYVNTGKWLTSFQFIPARFVDTEGNEYARAMADIEFDRPFTAGCARVMPFVRFRDVYYVHKQNELNNFVSSVGFNLRFLAKTEKRDRTVYFSPAISVFSNFPSEKIVPFSSDLYDLNPDGTFTSINLSWDFWKNNTRTGNIISMTFYDIGRNRFQDSIVMLDFVPNKQWSFHCQERFNLSDGGMKEMSNTILFQKNDMQVAIGNKYLSGYFDGITGSFSRRFGEWEFGVSMDYDTGSGRFTSQRYSIQKRVHCLVIGITYSKEPMAFGFFVIPSFLAGR